MWRASSAPSCWRACAVVAGFTRSPAKRELAERLGATVTAHPDEAPDLLDELTDGRGPEIVVEAAGYESTLAMAIELAGIGGEVLVFGTIAGGDKGLPYYQMYAKELTLHNPRAALIDDYATAVRLAEAGRINLEPIVTDTRPRRRRRRLCRGGTARLAQGAAPPDDPRAHHQGVARWSPRKVW